MTAPRLGAGAVDGSSYGGLNPPTAPTGVLHHYMRGALAAAVAVQWTDADARRRRRGLAAVPQAARRALALRRSRFRRRRAAYWRAPGRFGNIGLRYRLTAGGPWSPVSADRKEIDIVAVSPDDAAPRRAGRRLVGPRALHAGRRRPRRRLRARRRRGGGGGGAVDRGAGRPAEADWRDAVALADGRWHLGQAVAGNLDGIAVRWRLAAAGPWSAASQDRKPLSFPDLPIVPVLRRRPGARRRPGGSARRSRRCPGSGPGRRRSASSGAATARRSRARPRRATGRAAADDRTALSCRITADDRGRQRCGDHRRAGGDLRRPRGGGRRARRGDPRPGARDLDRRRRPGVPRRRPPLRGHRRRRHASTR